MTSCEHSRNGIGHRHASAMASITDMSIIMGEAHNTNITLLIQTTIYGYIHLVISLLLSLSLYPRSARSSIKSQEYSSIIHDERLSCFNGLVLFCAIWLLFKGVYFPHHRHKGDECENSLAHQPTSNQNAAVTQGVRCMAWMCLPIMQ